MTNKKRAFRPIVLCQTLDGKTHDSEKEAQEHAEAVAGKRLFELIGEAVPDVYSQVAHKIVCHMLRNSEAYADALGALHAFDAEEEG